MHGYGNGKGGKGARTTDTGAAHLPALPGLLLVLCVLAGCSRETGEAAQRGQALGCMRCHGMVTTYVGPGFAEIASRYRGDADAPARLRKVIRQGSVGTWGRVIMPRQSQVGEADAALLADWILGQPDKAP